MARPSEINRIRSIGILNTESLSENSDKLDAIEKKLEDNDKKSNKSNTSKVASDENSIDTGELDL